MKRKGQEERVEQIEYIKRGKCEEEQRNVKENNTEEVKV